jgi:hypothetical protein
MSHLDRTLVFIVLAAGCERTDRQQLEAEAVAVPSPAVSVSFETSPLHTELVVQQPPAPPEPVTPATILRAKLRHWYGLLSMESRQAVSEVCRWRFQNPCGAIIVGQHDPQSELLAGFELEDQARARTYCDEVRGRSECNTPLVVAFDGEPVQFANHLPTAATPWLAIDRDGDGAITSRAELFGDATVLANGATASNGFVALAALDDNHDGIIDRSDSAFARLLLWSDRNGDRTSRPSELQPASEVIISIPLANERAGTCTADGDCEGERGAVQWRTAAGGQATGAVVDVYVPR